MRISPVEVVILQLPPEPESGTLISPVDDFVMNTFSELSEPVTSPVEVFTVISPASQSSKLTPPVDLSMLNSPDATVFFSVTSPVLPAETRQLQR